MAHPTRAEWPLSIHGLGCLASAALLTDDRRGPRHLAADLELGPWDDVTESIEEHLAMGEAAVTSEKVELMGEPLSGTEPGETSELMTSLEREGRYIIACFIPRGFIPRGLIPEVLAGFGVTEDMPHEDCPLEAQAILDNPPHVAAGMFLEFTATAAGTELGPLPGAEESTERGAAETEAWADHFPMATMTRHHHRMAAL